MKTLSAITALLLLTGCQATFWAQPPMPGGGCDPAAPGRWISQPSADEGADAERMRLVVDSHCRLVAEKLRGGQVFQRSEPAQVRMARLGGQPYAWLDANTLLDYEGVAHRTDAGDVMVFRYRIDGGQLRIWNINHAHVRGLIQSGRISGHLDDNEEDEFNHITGPVPPELLAVPAFFDEAPTLLQREGG